MKQTALHTLCTRRTNVDVSLTWTSSTQKLTVKIDKRDGKVALQHSDLIYVKKTKGKGRGVFAKRPIRKGMIIEQVPVVIFPVQEIYTDTISTTLADYVFNWSNDEVAIALGYGSLYNHSYQPNAAYAAKGRRTQVYSALRNIRADEEITVNYNGCSKSRAELWFDAAH